MTTSNPIREIPSIRYVRLPVTQNHDGSLIRRLFVTGTDKTSKIQVRPDDEGHPILMIQPLTVMSDFREQLSKHGTILFVDADGLIRTYLPPPPNLRYEAQMLAANKRRERKAQ